MGIRKGLEAEKRDQCRIPHRRPSLLSCLLLPGCLSVLRSRQTGFLSATVAFARLGCQQLPSVHVPSHSLEDVESSIPRFQLQSTWREAPAGLIWVG